MLDADYLLVPTSASDADLGATKKFLGRLYDANPLITGEKIKFLPLQFFIISSSPGSKTGSFFKFLLFHNRIFSSSTSTTLIFISGHFSAITDIVGPPTYPAPMQQIFLIFGVIIFLKYINPSYFFEKFQIY